MELLLLRKCLERLMSIVLDDLDMCRYSFHFREFYSRIQALVVWLSFNKSYAENKDKHSF